ncbi:MAG: bifunctional dihydroorotate dehydrogenase B NAD binding subunit/NADPH-dependent glutamate synthase [Prevotella sp.]|nr:bifunctional dihydroorotate dehydrogenase B NAD binding subunit/NADPH-dependent glutamate synthase [Prevotella sp.]
MYKVKNKQQLSEKVFLFEVEAPLIAKARKAGHFVIIRVDGQGERVPLTIADADIAKGTITLVVQEVGLSSQKLCKLNVGDSIHDVVGPLGNATHIENFGTVLCAGGGVGVAPMLPIIKALKATGNRVIAVLAGRNKNLIILENEVRKYADEVVIMTDDGSYGKKGVITVGMEEIIQREKVDKCFAIGPAIMMKFCCLLTQQYNIPTDVSLNTIMVDGTGMCGACRLKIGGETKFVCIDGPEFDGALVDWDEMLKRLNTFKKEEQHALATVATPKATVSEVSTSRRLVSVPDVSTSGEPLTDRDAEWRKTLRASMKAKERTAIDRISMPELNAQYRICHRKEEVNQGLTAEMAVKEAKRCLDCANPTCMTGCPVNIPIPAFIKNIERGHFLDAARVIKSTSSLPAVCGRVCPQEKQCESLCIHNKMGKEPVAIGYLERFVADYEASSGKATTPQRKEANGIKIAIVGSGPAGLSCAGDMAKNGYDVHVFEALHEIGGVLKYGIPEFRLPNHIVDTEIDNLKRLGVTFHTDCIIGKTLTIKDLEDTDFRGFFIASGAGLPNFMGIPGENSIGIMSSNEYLTRINLMDAANPDTDTPVLIGKKVLVIGGGNTAMDSCRTAKRLGGDVTLVYRRGEEEMPARKEEVKHAKEEGIRFLTLHNPKEYIADENGAVKAAILDVMALGEADESGRRRPEKTGETITLECDQVIVAVGVSPNPLVPKSITGLELGRKNTIVVNEDMKSNMSNIYAGGDIVRGGATVILAMGDGRRAAEAMHQYFINK